MLYPTELPGRKELMSILLIRCIQVHSINRVSYLLLIVH